MSNFKLLTVLSLSLLLQVSPVSAARVLSGGIAPSNAGICDAMSDSNPGLTKGLQGLCVAYCEARDYRADIGDVGALGRNDVAKGKILANYNRKKKAGDPDMPCVASNASCPAWSAAEIAAVGSRGYSKIRDDHLLDVGYLNRLSDEERVVSKVDFPSAAMGVNNVWADHFVNGVDDPADDTYAAGYQDYETHFDEELNEWVSNHYTENRYVTDITKAEYNACKNQILSNVVE